MNVHFIDTSILCNILDIPSRNQDVECVKKEFSRIIKNPDSEKLILPFASIVETGNHISHITDGNKRWKCANDFSLMLRKTVDNEAPWSYYGRQLTEADLEIISDKFPEAAMRMEMGVGDLSIIQAYEHYKDETPAIGKIRIWSIDKHLSTYQDTLVADFLRNR